MAGFFTENFELYRGDAALMTQGRWSSVGADGSLSVPPFDPESRVWRLASGRFSACTKALGASYSEIGAWCRVHFPALPAENNVSWPIYFNDGVGRRITIAVTTTGAIQAYDGTTLLGTSSSQPIMAGVTSTIQVQISMSATIGTVDVRVDGVDVLNLDTLSIDGTLDVLGTGHNSGLGLSITPFWTKAFALYTTDTPPNDDWPVIDDVITLRPVADTSQTGFEAFPRQKFGSGILYTQGAGYAVVQTGADNQTNFDNLDFTVEAFVRFVRLPELSQDATLLGRWREGALGRTWRIVKYGPDANSGELRVELGAPDAAPNLNLLVTAITTSWNPQVGQWYHIALVRSGTSIRLFLDGVKVGQTYTWPYATGLGGANSVFSLGGVSQSATFNLLAGTSADVMFDEVRLTRGTARYSANFTPPTAAFPRSAPSDPDFANVRFLAGFDIDLSNEQPSFAGAIAITAVGDAFRNEPQDLGADYLSVTVNAPLDDRYIAARLTRAEGVLTASGNPSNTETLVIGSRTYTFVTALTAADQVLIGADAGETIANLIAAINNGAGEGSVYGTGTAINADVSATLGPSFTDPVQMTVEAKTAGAGGNSIATTETSAVLSWDGATLSGGQDIPGPSSFVLADPPSTITGVRWVETVARAGVFSGSATIDLGTTVSGSYSAGTPQSLSTSPQYVSRVENASPAGGGWTPVALANAEATIERDS